MAQLRIYLPWTPVPITGQTFAVLIGAIILGKTWSGISQLIYIVLGVLGVPWFSNGQYGISIIFGPTGGYLIGFVFASYFIGNLTGNYKGVKNYIFVFLMMLFANYVIIYSFGLTQLYLWYYASKGYTIDFITLLKMGFLPFVFVDLIKIFITSIIGFIVIPEKKLK